MTHLLCLFMITTRTIFLSRIRGRRILIFIEQGSMQNIERKLEANDALSSQKIKTPSFPLVLLIFAVGSFGSYILIFILQIIYKYSPYSRHILKPYHYESKLTIFIIFSSFIIFFLIKYYRTYLFPLFRKSNLFKHLLAGVIFSLPIIGIDLFFQFVPSLRQVLFDNYLLSVKSTIKNIDLVIVILYSATLFTASIKEELIFRGIIQQQLHLSCNNIISIFLSTLIFTLTHIIVYSVFSSFHIISLLKWFFVGFLCAVSYSKNKSCISPIVIHLISNSYGFLIGPIMIFLM